MTTDNNLTYLYDTDTGDLSSMDAVKRCELLSAIEELGLLSAAAAEVGLTMDMLSDAMTHDPRLEADIELATGRHRAMIIRRMTDLGFNGSEKAIIGGRNKDEILGVDRVPNDKALELMSKIHFPNELAIRTAQRITAEIKPTGKDEVKADFSKLGREDRKALETIFRKAQKLVEAEDK